MKYSSSYKFAKSLETIDMYNGDSNILAKNKRERETLRQTIRIYGSDRGRRIDFEKYAPQIRKSGKDKQQNE